MKRSSRDFSDIAARLHGRSETQSFASMDAFSRHKKFMSDYMKYYSHGRSLSTGPAGKTDYDILREHHRFIRSEKDDDHSWEGRLARTYYDKLFKEYAIADLSRYKENKIGFRWRVHKEVLSGKGQFICGAKQCESTENLTTYEVNFAYVERGERLNALVKLRLCQNCAVKLYYKHIKEARRKAKRLRKSQRSDGGQKRSRLENLTVESLPDQTALDPEHARPGSPTSKDSSGKREGEEEGAEERNEEEEEESEGEDAAAVDNRELSAEEVAVLASKVWSAKPSVEKTREEEFEDYFRGMFP